MRMKLKYSLAAGLVVCLASITQPAGAETKQFDTASGNWNVTGNWSPTGIPAAADEVKISYSNNTCFIPNGYTATALRMYVYSEGTGSLVVSGTMRVTTNWIKVGYDYRFGRLYQTGDVLLDNGADLIIGDGADSRYTTGYGKYYLQGGTLSVDQVRIGDRAGNGYMYQSGGTAIVNRINVGYDGTGTYQMTGGTIYNSGDLRVGYAYLAGTAATGTFTHSAGTMTTEGDIHIGYNADGTGTYTLSGSGVALGRTDKGLYVGRYGTGTYNQTGGSMVIGTVNIAANAGSTGVLNLSGGSMVANTVSKGSGTATFNFTGGTLKTDNVAFAFTNSGGLLDVGVGGVNGSATIGGNLTLSSGTLKMELASLASYDKLAVTGSAAVGGVLDISLLSGYTPNYNDSWTILTASAGITGSFSAIPTDYSVSLAGGGTQMVLTYVPEPSTILLLALGAMLRLGLGRRTRSTGSKAKASPVRLAA